MNEDRDEQMVSAHYGQGELASRILDALRAAGKDIEHLRVEDLEPIDQFHIGGKWATLQLLQRAPLQPGTKVLDVGGGIGGTARLLAEKQGCFVTVLDLTEEYCRVGEMLTQRTGLADRVTFQHGSALDMPFPDALFEAVWTQHSSMNIEDKDQLYREIGRVLQPGGRLALFEVMEGKGGPVHFPVPWADDATISFLRPSEEVRGMIINAGLREVSWADVTEMMLARLQEGAVRQARADPGTPLLGLHILLGAKFPEMVHNVQRNLAEGRITLFQAVFERV